MEPISSIGLITDVVRKGPKVVNSLKPVTPNTKSVARGSKDTTFQFPCLVSNSISIDMANTVARTLDQVYASFTQTWLSVNSMFDITIDPTPLSYLRKIHQNMRLEGVELVEDDVEVINENDFNQYMEKVWDGSARAWVSEDDDYAIIYQHTNPTMDIMESHQSQLRPYLSDFDLEPLEPVTEADDVDATDIAANMIGNTLKSRDLKDRQLISDKMTAPKLLDRDVKRSNDLVPYAIQIRLMAVNDKKEFVNYVDIVIGIKTILHSVESSEMVENIGRALQNKSPMFKFLRWTTGEISLMKDLIFNIKDIKDDAINKASGKSPFFATLKRLKSHRLNMRNITVPGFLVPNSTIIIGDYEVGQLTNKFGINITNNKVALKLMKQLFLMSFGIIDTAANTVSMLYDGDNHFQTYSLETLERDNAMHSNSLLKELGRVVTSR